MMKFLTTNIKYPVEAQKKGVSGRVIVQFVIMEDGTLDQAKVEEESIPCWTKKPCA